MSNRKKRSKDYHPPLSDLITEKTSVDEMMVAEGLRVAPLKLNQEEFRKSQGEKELLKALKAELKSKSAKVTKS